jgi:hypothetical protein
MSEDQEKIVNDLIEEAHCAAKEARDAKKKFSILIQTLFVAIIIAISSVPLIQWQVANLAKENNYIRENAVNKKAFYNLMETYKANIEGLTKLIDNKEIKAVINEFNTKTDAIINRIMTEETEIVPRGARNEANTAETKKGGND